MEHFPGLFCRRTKGDGMNVNAIRDTEGVYGIVDLYHPFHRVV